MKKADLTHLSQLLRGTITTSEQTRSYFAIDGSIFTEMPEAVCYPWNEDDIRTLLQYLHEKAAVGRPVATLTARGRGSDQTGAAIGTGIELVLPPHLNRVIKLDKSTVTVQPGVVYRELEALLGSHGRFLPPYPSSVDVATIGGATANNSAGEKSVKYGSIRPFVKRLKVVLSDGSVIETRRLSARELNRKKGQTDLEGEIYRLIDGLVLDNAKLLAKTRPKTTKNAAGYDIWDVRRKDGSFDLSHLVIGSQGTLGVITEITLRTVVANPKRSLVVGYFDDLTKAGEAMRKVVKLDPSALEIVDDHLLRLVRELHPKALEGIVPERLPRLVVLAEFDDASQLRQTIKARRTLALFGRLGTNARLSTAKVEQERLWQLRHSAADVITMVKGSKKALPFIEDGAVPPTKLPQLLEKTYALLRKHDAEAAIWGHGGDANLHIQPFLDLAKPKDVEKLYAIADGYADIILSLGGTLSAEHGDGLMRGPYLKQQFGDELYGVFEQIKRAFDPHQILNPGKKTGVDLATARLHLRREYSMPHLHDRYPH